MRLTDKNTVIVVPRGISRWLIQFEGGDIYMATSGDFLMAVDTLPARRDRCASVVIDHSGSNARRKTPWTVGCQGSSEQYCLGSMPACVSQDRPDYDPAATLAVELDRHRAREDGAEIREQERKQVGGALKVV